jgi:CheY-specific phosphatase CheX
MAAAPVKTSDAASKAPQHQKAFIAAFVNATVDTLALQCATKVGAGEPVDKADHEEKGTEVIVVGAITGKGIECSVAFCFSEAACCQLVGGMLQKKVVLGGDQVMAAASEIVRIIGFQAKRLLVERGYKVEAVFPRVVLEGKTVQIWADKMRQGVVVPFETPRGDHFSLELF